MPIKKTKIIVREREQLKLFPSDLDEPENPMDHLLLNVMIDYFHDRGKNKS